MGTLRIKRIYRPADVEDGMRILADRLWPRGVSRESASLDSWERSVAPTDELCRWFHHDAERSSGFSVQYLAELDGNPAASDLAKRIDDELRKRNVTLLYAARDEKYNHAAILRDWLLRHIEAVSPHDKQALRREYLKRQNSLPNDYVTTASSSIQAQVLASPQYMEAKSLFVYMSTGKEPSTERIIQRALADRKRVYIPKCVNKRDMLAIRIRRLEGLASGALGILEPADSSETAIAAELDLILVPCVSASDDGKRLGHGAGYYDRYLAGHSEKAVCLCFRRMLCSEIPMDSHDVYMSQVISEVL